MIRVFIGYDPRQPIAYNVLAHSVASRASGPVSITRLQLNQIDLKRRGLTEFSFSRYMVPHLCKYEGKAIFMDADMLCLGDIYELDEICSPQIASVCVSKNKLKFEWSSLMYFNNAHCRDLKPKLIEDGQPQNFDSWATSVGEFGGEWNHLVGYDTPRTDAKIVHYTQGIPCFPEVAGCEYEQEWRQEHAMMNGTVSWAEIMGKSVHAKPVLERLSRAA